MIKIEQTLVVDRPLEEVFQFMLEPANIFKWSRNIEEISQLTKGKLDVGSQYELISRFMGTRVPTRVEVTKFVPNVEYATRSIGGPFFLNSLTRFEADGNNTRVITTSEITPTGFWKLLEPILPSVIRRQSEADYVRLRQELSKSLKNNDQPMHILNLTHPTVTRSSRSGDVAMI